ncbi:amino acid permease 1-like [Apium graveolens]|uniref:amino acid permease 1-like n=1 Tax=Apium graveolens TaxID=4045 RepID=UPI003D7A6D94
MAEKTVSNTHSVEMSIPVQAGSKFFDDDGRLKRTGTVWTVSAHIITAVIGSGVLSLAWATAQLGWIAGPTVLLLFSFVTYYTSCLLASCYRSGDPVTGKRNYTYMEAVKANLGGLKVKLCGAIQYLNLFRVAIGYTIAASISMRSVKRSYSLLSTQEELLDKDQTINSLPADEDNLKEQTTTLPTDVYQQIPARSYKQKLVSLFNKLLLCFNQGDKQNKRRNDSTSLHMDDECGTDILYSGVLSSNEYTDLFSKLSYERKGFDGRGNDSQEPVPVPTSVLNT